MTTYYYSWTDGFDRYYGYTYDSDGSQGLYDGYTYSATNADGSSVLYEVYATVASNAGGLAEDRAYHESYSDSETGQTDYSPYASALYGYAYGYGMLGSYDYVDFDDGNYTYGFYGYYGTYEADDQDSGATYYYRWTNGYDVYYGYTYDADGSQLLYEGYYSAEWVDENGYTSSYEVYAVELGNSSGLLDDYAYHTSYYDYETGQTDYDPNYSVNWGYAQGLGMLGSYDYVDFDDGLYYNDLYGDYGYYEADDPEAGNTYVFYWSNGYDIAYGYTYDADGSQGLSTGYIWVTTDENGYTSYYYVYGSTSGDYYGLSTDDNAAYGSYYDYETGQTDSDPYFSTTYGYSFGSGMIGAYDYIDFDDGNYSGGVFGDSGYFEADDQDNGATFLYYWSDGYDIYYGYTFDADGTQGLYTGFTYSATDENGRTSYYYVYGEADGDYYGIGVDDAAVHWSYYDYESGITDYDPYYTTAYGAAGGSGMLASYDYVDMDTGEYGGGFYGSYGYYEADTGQTYLYYWTDGSDIYYGYTWDADGSQGLYQGYSISTTDENGVVGYYYVYGATAGNYYGLAADDLASHWSYYDSETGVTDYDPYFSTTYGYAFGTGMLGSYDYVDLDTGDYTVGLYGANGYYEADDPNGGTTYYYSWTNGYDVYYGYTWDADGSQGLYTSFTYAATDEHGNASTYSVYATAEGNAEGLSGDDYAYHTRYYDMETDQSDYTPYYSATYGYAFGLGMVGSYDYVDFDDGDYTHGLYGDNGVYEADYSDGSDGYTYFYYWTDGGDYYYGYTYDSDGSQGLSEGGSYSPEYGSYYDEQPSGIYEVYAATPGSPLGLEDDRAYIQYYYDVETDQFDYDPYYSSTQGFADWNYFRYGFYYHKGMMGSSDMVDFDDGDYTDGTFGRYGELVADDT